MRKYLLLLAVLFTSFVFAQIVNIPDAKFKAELLEASPSNTIAKDLNGSYFKIDANGNGEIEVSEAENVAYLDVASSYISTLEGILSFKNLQTLDCHSNQLTSLNVQGCTYLQTLYCYGNQLPSLNVQGLSNLQGLYCNNNQLTSLDVQGLTNLQYLWCYNNQLPSLNVQGLTNLQNLHCYNNQLTSLNVQGCTNLKILYCNNNKLTSLDVQGLTNLQYLYCYSNQLTSLNIKTGGNQIWNTLYFYSNPNLKYICCNEKDIPTVLQQVKTNGQTAEVNTYCSFEPTGNKNTITGKVSLDLDANGCDANNVLAKNIKLKISDGTCQVSQGC